MSRGDGRRLSLPHRTRCRLAIGYQVGTNRVLSGYSAGSKAEDLQYLATFSTNECRVQDLTPALPADDTARSAQAAYRVCHRRRHGG